MGNNKACATNYNHRIAATLYTLETCFFRRIIVRLNTVLNADDDDNDNNNNNNNNK
jgi:hypothetical protein